MRRLRLPQPPHRGRVVELAVSGRLGRWFHRNGWGGVTLPLPFVTLILYWLADPGADVSERLRVHEFVHVAQNERDCCWLASWLRYGWAFLRVLRWRDLLRRPRAALRDAYAAHPAEAEAYAIASRSDR
jgi:hypothetical protein